MAVLANPTVVTAETKTLTDSIERVSVVISEKQKSPVRCVFEDGQVRMSAKTAIGGCNGDCFHELYPVSSTIFQPHRQTFHPACNVICGENAQGKTNLLDPPPPPG